MFSYILTFVLVFAVDIIYTYYLNSIYNGQALKAGILAAIVWLIGSLAVIEYTTNHWLLIPACAGAFCGTFFGIRFKRR